MKQPENATETVLKPKERGQPLQNDVNILEVNPHRDFLTRQSSLEKEFKEAKISKGDKVKIGSMLEPQFEAKLVDVLRRNIGAFSWSSTDMLGIDPNFLHHKLVLDSSAKPVIRK